MSMFPGIPAVTAPTEQVREYGEDADHIRQMSLDGKHPGIRQRMWGLEARLDRTVTFEEFNYWAKIEREMEEEEFRRYKASTSSAGLLGGIKGYFTSNPYEDAKKKEEASRNLQNTEGTLNHDNEKPGLSVIPSDDVRPIGPSETHDFDAEWRQAARALRTAGWAGIFYLITTDILGWGQTPYVFANTGYGLGVGIFVLMGIAAAASGWMIWKTFLGLDSSRYPMLSYSDPFFRLFGTRARYIISVMQAIQLLFMISVVLLGQTGIIAQLAGNVNLCLTVCGVISLVVSMASGYMRSLKHLGWFCNAAVWINVITFIIICVAAAKFGPDPVPQVLYGGILPHGWAKNPAPVKTFVNAPPSLYQPTDRALFPAKFNGINSMVYAYSGAILFIAFLSEMRHPMDFWKAVLLAQSFICVIYVFFGAFTYTFYGQYSYSVINQVVKPLSLQIVSNVLSLITGWLAVFLYFNIGMKNLYIEVGQEIFRLPAITTSRGKYLWWSLGPLYWILAFVVSMSIPQFNAFTNFIGGLFSLNFTYSFSGIMFLGYQSQLGAQLEGEGFDPATGITTRHDGGVKRFARGYLKKWKITIPVTIYVGCGLACSGMGTWAAILALEAAFKSSVVTSWTCVNPYYNAPSG